MLIIRNLNLISIQSWICLHGLTLRGEKLNYKSVAKEISKPPFLASEVQWASKFTVFV